MTIHEPFKLLKNESLKCNIYALNICILRDIQKLSECVLQATSILVFPEFFEYLAVQHLTCL